MLELTAEDIGENLHVTVRVGREATTASDPVLVDHSQTAEAHLLWVVVVGKGEAVASVEPTVVGMSSVL